jgi:hypothetical protein
MSAFSVTPSVVPPSDATLSRDDVLDTLLFDAANAAAGQSGSEHPLVQLSLPNRDRMRNCLQNNGLLNYEAGRDAEIWAIAEISPVSESQLISVIVLDSFQAPPGTRWCLENAAFYSYAYPEPTGFADVPVKPDAAFYSTDLPEFILPNDVVRESTSPDETLLDFLQITHEGANLGNWDRMSLERRHEPCAKTRGKRWVNRSRSRTVVTSWSSVSSKRSTTFQVSQRATWRASPVRNTPLSKPEQLKTPTWPACTGVNGRP